MRIEGKKSTLGWFFAIVWLPSVVLFMLQATGNFGDYIQTGFYVSVTIACLVVLGTLIKSDDVYYENLNLPKLLASIVVGLLMTALSWGLSLQLHDEKLLSVGYTMSFIAAPSSIATIFLSLVIFGLVMAATSEELLKLAMFSKLKERYGDRWYGVFIYVGVPVFFWSILHGIMAYQNLIMILPAFINGVVLIILLIRTKSVLCAVLSHWLYNSGILLIQFLNGSANVPAGTGLLPNFASITVADIAILMVFIMSIAFFLLPVLFRDKN
jgi:membrane protease YdiL (CAAX protease family)